jgi:fatty acid desaturase
LNIPSVKGKILNMATGFDRKHSRIVILIRGLVTVWLLALTGVLLAYGHWPWALLTLAGAAANTVLAYRVSRTRTS